MRYKTMRYELILILSLIETLVTDIVDDVHNEEQNNHKDLLSKIRSVLLTSRVTEEETAEADKLLAESYPLGDPVRKLPDNEAKMEQNLCRVHKERADKLLKYARKRYAIQLITQVCARLVIKGFTAQNDRYCRDASSRKQFINHAIIVNSRSGIYLARSDLMDRSIVASNASLSAKNMILPVMCCAFWAYKKSTLASLPETETKNFVADMIQSYLGYGAQYLCLYHKENSKVCADLVYPKLPANYGRRPQSHLMPCLDATARVTSLIRS